MTSRTQSKELRHLHPAGRLRNYGKNNQSAIRRRKKKERKEIRDQIINEKQPTIDNFNQWKAIEYWEDYCLCEKFHRTEADIQNSSADFIFAIKSIQREINRKQNKEINEQKEKQRKQEVLNRLRSKHGVKKR
ncbi:MAG: hypothetical protein LBG52_01955 [Candidatus Peribacteria bacterium]|jgi:hypothetical protein|nr:hypothetical protein [Candidatus Peribacteria bacterium]